MVFRTGEQRLSQKAVDIFFGYNFWGINKAIFLVRGKWHNAIFFNFPFKSKGVITVQRPELVYENAIKFLKSNVR